MGCAQRLRDVVVDGAGHFGPMQCAITSQCRGRSQRTDGKGNNAHNRPDSSNRVHACPHFTPPDPRLPRERLIGCYRPILGPLTQRRAIEVSR
jgi:hypothetical protein